jgi:lysophospholipase L1-like esterase
VRRKLGSTELTTRNHHVTIRDGIDNSPYRWQPRMSEPTVPGIDADVALLIDFNIADVPACVGLEAGPAAASALFGLDLEAYQAYTASVQAEVEASARLLLDDPALSSAVDAFPIPPGGTLLFVGDSITAYRRSYARLLAALLAQRRPGDDIRVVNGGRSGFTTSHGLELTYVQFLGLAPDVVLVGLGGNDCKRFGATAGDHGQRLIPPDDYRRNLSGIVDAFLGYTGARILIAGPTPVASTVADANPDFAAQRVHWENADLRECTEIAAQVASERGLVFVDHMAALGPEPDPRLYLADGLHPNAEGHALMLHALLEALAQAG